MYKIHFFFLWYILQLSRAIPITYDIIDFQVQKQNFKKDITIDKDQQKNLLTIWGWIRFEKNYMEYIETNILDISNIYIQNKGFQEDTTQSCPWTFQQLKNDLNIRHSEEFQNNNECLAYLDYISTKQIMNLTQRQGQFSLQLTNNDQQNTQENIIFKQQFDFDKNEWNKISMSINLKDKFATISLQNYTYGQVILQKDFQSINLQQIQLENNIEITFGKTLTEEKDYSWQIQRFFFANDYFEDIQYLYMIESKNDQQSLEDIFVDHYFYQNQKIDSSLQIKGDYIKINTSKNQQYGIILDNDNQLQIQTSEELKNNDQIMFLVTFELLEFRQNQIILFQQGQIENNNSLSITIHRDNKNIYLVYLLKGNNDIIEYKSEKNISLNNIHNIMFGIKIQPNNDTILIIKQDDNEFKIIGSKTSNQFNIYTDMYQMLNNTKPNDDQFKIKFYRFTAIYNLQPFFLSLQNQQSLQCQQKLTLYDENLCLICKDFLLQPSYTCDNKCPFGYFNSGYDICLKCFSENCSSISRNQYKITQEDNAVYLLEFNNQIKDTEIKIEDLIQIKILRQSQEVFNSYEYRIQKNQQDIYVISISFYEELIGGQIQISLQSNKQYIYFENGDFLYDGQQTFFLNYVCHVNKNALITIQFFAYFVMTLFGLCFIMLLIATCTNRKNQKNYSTLWKYLLMIWIKIQNVSMSYLVGTNGPCTSGLFFETLFKINAKWMNTSYFFESIYKDVPSYENFLQKNQPQNQTFFNNNIQRFILNNVGIILLFHLIVFLIFMIIKFISTESKSKTIRKILYIFQYNLLIVIYLIFCVQINIYAFINLRKSNENSFIVSTLLSIFYIIFFILFVLYFFGTIVRNKRYWEKEPLNKKLFFFTCGYRNIQFVKTFDLVVFSISFLQWFFIGFLYQEPLIQTILLFITNLIVIVCAVVYGPWVYKSINILEAVSIFFGSIPLVFAIVIASWSKTENPFTGDREGFIAYSILVSILISLMISFVLFLILLFEVTFKFYKMKNIQYPKNPFLIDKRQVKKQNKEESFTVDISEDDEYSKNSIDQNELVQIKYKPEAKKRIIQLKSLKSKSNDKILQKNQKSQIGEEKTEKIENNNKESINIEQKKSNKDQQNQLSNEISNETFSDNDV